MVGGTTVLMTAVPLETVNVGMAVPFFQCGHAGRDESAGLRKDRVGNLRIEVKGGGRYGHQRSTGFTHGSPSQKATDAP
jgi:hypothetical protein